MHLKRVHDWPTGPSEAIRVQTALAELIRIEGNTPEPRRIAAVDCDYGQEGRFLYAAAVVLDFPDLTECERSYARVRVTFPYIPGLYYFREGPAMVQALAKLTSTVDLLMVSGHGQAHPSQCGIASLVGVVFDKPAIGVARRLLVGSHRRLDHSKGSTQPVDQDGKEIGLAYRSKDNVKPIFISPGHQCDLAFARLITVQTLRGYRQPEPLRLAHLLAGKRRRSDEREMVAKLMVAYRPDRDV